MSELQDCLDNLMNTADGNPEWSQMADASLIVVLKYLIDLEGQRQLREPVREAQITSEAAFLIERLEDINWTGDGYPEIYRDYMGHVAPSMARLKDLLGMPK